MALYFHLFLLLLILQDFNFWVLLLQHGLQIKTLFFYIKFLYALFL